MIVRLQLSGREGQQQRLAALACCAGQAYTLHAHCAHCSLACIQRTDHEVIPQLLRGPALPTGVSDLAGASSRHSPIAQPAPLEYSFSNTGSSPAARGSSWWRWRLPPPGPRHGDGAALRVPAPSLRGAQWLQQPSLVTTYGRFWCPNARCPSSQLCNGCWEAQVGLRCRPPAFHSGKCSHWSTRAALRVAFLFQRVQPHCSLQVHAPKPATFCVLPRLVPADGQVLSGLFVRVKSGQYDLAQVQQLSDYEGKQLLVVQVREGWCAGLAGVCAGAPRVHVMVPTHFTCCAVRRCTASSQARPRVILSCGIRPARCVSSCHLQTTNPCVPCCLQLPTDRRGLDGTQVRVNRCVPLTTVSGTNSLEDANWEALGRAELERLAAYMQGHGLELPLEEVRGVEECLVTQFAVCKCCAKLGVVEVCTCMLWSCFRSATSAIAQVAGSAWRKQAALAWHAQHGAAPPAVQQQHLPALLQQLADAAGIAGMQQRLEAAETSPRRQQQVAFTVSLPQQQAAGPAGPAPPQPAAAAAAVSGAAVQPQAAAAPPGRQVEYHPPSLPPAVAFQMPQQAAMLPSTAAGAAPPSAQQAFHPAGAAAWQAPYMSAPLPLFHPMAGQRHATCAGSNQLEAALPVGGQLQREVSATAGGLQISVSGIAAHAHPLVRTAAASAALQQPAQQLAWQHLQQQAQQWVQAPLLAQQQLDWGQRNTGGMPQATAFELPPHLRRPDEGSGAVQHAAPQLARRPPLAGEGWLVWCPVSGWLADAVAAGLRLVHSMLASRCMLNSPQQHMTPLHLLLFHPACPRRAACASHPFLQQHHPARHRSAGRSSSSLGGCGPSGGTGLSHGCCPACVDSGAGASPAEAIWGSQLPAIQRKVQRSNGGHGAGEFFTPLY